MSEIEIIQRIAARGDGITASGRHVAGGVPGDHIAPDGTLTPGPHHVTPPCRHFPTCGGCQLQHADEEALRQFVTDRVVHAAEGQGIAPATLLETHLSPPRSRRRATLHGTRTGRSAVLGFREGGSHRIVDMRECHILTPELFALVAPLKTLIAAHGGRQAVDIELTLADQGIDCLLKGIAAEGLAATEALLDFARDHALARLSLDNGFGPETLWEPEPLTVTLGAVPVPFPQGSFLQPTPDGGATSRVQDRGEYARAPGADAAPRPVPQPAAKRRGEPVRRGPARSAARGRTRAGGADRREHGHAGGLCQLQSGELGA